MNWRNCCYETFCETNCVPAARCHARMRAVCHIGQCSRRCACRAETAQRAVGSKAIAAAVVVGLVATAGALGMAIAIGKSTEGMSRQPEASGSIRSAMMLGLVFIETAIIYALIVAILIIFVL